MPFTFVGEHHLDSNNLIISVSDEEISDPFEEKKLRGLGDNEGNFNQMHFRALLCVENPENKSVIFVCLWHVLGREHVGKDVPSGQKLQLL